MYMTCVYGKKKNLLAHGPKCVHTAQCASIHPAIHGNQTREAFQLIVEAENKLKLIETRDLCAIVHSAEKTPPLPFSHQDSHQSRTKLPTWEGKILEQKQKQF